MLEIPSQITPVIIQSNTMSRKLNLPLSLLILNKRWVGDFGGKWRNTERKVESEGNRRKWDGGSMS